MPGVGPWYHGGGCGVFVGVSPHCGVYVRPYVVLAFRCVDVFDGGLSFQGEEEVCARGLRVHLCVPEPQVREPHGAGENFPPREGALW